MLYIRQIHGLHGKNDCCFSNNPCYDTHAYVISNSSVNFIAICNKYGGLSETIGNETQTNTVEIKQLTSCRISSLIFRTDSLQFSTVCFTLLYCWFIRSWKTITSIIGCTFKCTHVAPPYTHTSPIDSSLFVGLNVDTCNSTEQNVRFLENV